MENNTLRTGLSRQQMVGLGISFVLVAFLVVLQTNVKTDFTDHWQAANLTVTRQNPYTPGWFLYPYPYAFFLAWIGLIPYPVAAGIWACFNLGALYGLARERYLPALAFFPVLLTLALGQVDLILFALGMCGGWLGLALTALKPQMAVWIIPFMLWQRWRVRQYREIGLTLAAVALIYLIPTLAWPGWIAAWQQAAPPVTEYLSRAASLAGVPYLLGLRSEIGLVIVAALALITAWRLRPDFWTFMAAFNPFANPYSLVVLIKQVDLGVFVVSWLAFPLALVLHTGVPWALIPIYLIGRDWVVKHKAQRTQG